MPYKITAKKRVEFPSDKVLLDEGESTTIPELTPTIKVGLDLGVIVSEEEKPKRGDPDDVRGKSTKKSTN